MNNIRLHIVLRTHIMSLAALLFTGILLMPPALSAADEFSPGYQYDMRGNVVRDSNGNCKRTSQWSPSNAIAKCDPGLVKERDASAPVREQKGRVTGVEAQVDVLVLQAGKTFPFDSAELSDFGKQLLASAAAKHKDVYIHRVSIAGFTDKIGNDDYNLWLSERRAEAVKNELVANGLPAERIRVSGYGSDNPLVSCPGLAGDALLRCLAPNRRVEVRFVIPVVSTEAAVELVSRRRQEEVREGNVQAEAMAVDTPIINRGINDAVKIVGDGCSREIASFCADVPVGGGRVLNCLHTHSTQLSKACEGSIRKGMNTIESALGNANFFGAQCAPSIDRFCSGVTPGAGLLLDCLMDHVNNLERRCYMAMRDLQLFED